MRTDTRVIKPLEFAPAQLLSTTATNPDPVWSAGSYARGTKVTFNKTVNGVTLPHQFESLADANTATPIDATKWLDLGYANTVAMFNRKDVARATRATGILTVVIAPGTYTDSLALFGLVGNLVTLDVLEADGTTVVESRSEDLLDRAVTTMLEYLWLPFLQKERVVWEALPLFPGRLVRITVEGEIAAIGAACYGQMKTLGLPPQYGASWELTDFIGVTRDQFGNLTDLFPEAPYADTVNLTVWVARDLVPALKAVLTSLRQVPTVWIGSGGLDPYRSVLITLGVFDQVSLAIPYPKFSILDLRVIGVTTD